MSDLGKKITKHKLMVSLDDDDLIKMMRRYHFSDSDYEDILAMSRAMEPLVDINAFCVYKESYAKIEEKNFYMVFVTLGDGIDRLQGLYADRQCLSEAYIIDCIGSELLMKAYEKLVKELQKECGKWAKKIDFLGDKYSMELLPELYEECKPEGIRYNEQFVLIPSKSVVFLLPMSEKKTNDPCLICANCGNKDCIFRTKAEVIPDNRIGMNYADNMSEERMHYTYGYMKIYGKEQGTHG